MHYVATIQELQMLKARAKHLYCKLELLDKNLNVLDSLEGLAQDGSISIDADADIRHTFSSTIYLKKNEAISKYSTEDWVDKLVHVYIGMKPVGGSIYWYSKGVYAFNTNGFTYNATEHNVSISCVDLVALLDGSLSGTLTGTKTTIQMGLKIKQAIIDTFKLAISYGFIGHVDYMVDYWNRTIPYDIDFDTASSIWSILTQLRDLHYPFEMYFDDTTFVCQEIPSGFDDPIIMESDDFQDLVISESNSVDYSEIKNCIELFGASIDYDTYAENMTHTATVNEFAVTSQPEYITARKEYDSKIASIKDAYYDVYGNIDNINRPKIKWTADTMEKYAAFIKENPYIEDGDYSTVCGADDPWGDTEETTVQIAFTPLLVSGDTLIPLVNEDILSYIDEIVSTARTNCNNVMSKLPDEILKLDKTGIQKSVYGEQLTVKNMIAAVEGAYIKIGEKSFMRLSAVDVCAISGWSEEELINKFGKSSTFVGHSMHDVQSEIWNAKDKLQAVHDDIVEKNSGAVKTSNVVLNVTNLDMENNCNIALTTPFEGFCKTVNITINNTVTGTDGESTTQNVYPHGPFTLYSSDVDEDGTDVPIDGTKLAADTMIVIKYSKDMKALYYRGEQQTHAMVMLVDKQPTEEELKKYKRDEACNNIKFISLEESTDSITEANPRFTIEKIGRRNKVCSGSEYEVYYTDESAMQCAEYELWKSCRLTDSVNVECLLIPWLEVNQKITYVPKYIDTHGEALEFIIKKIDISIGEGTMTLTLMRYFPYYPYIVQNKY
jgi:hypothetical protein